MEFIPIYAGILGIFIAVGLFILVLTKDSGSGKIEDISNKIHLGAMTFIKREYSILFIFVAIVAILIFFSNQASEHPSGESCFIDFFFERNGRTTQATL